MIDDWSQDQLVKPRQFWMLLERADHLDRPFESNVNESESSHVMMGTW